ncbi:MAG: hypothetical protein QM784_40380 [Polyangiaceae bacterium]
MPQLSTYGRVCFCEWSGPVTVTMLVLLLSELRHMPGQDDCTRLLILNLRPSSANNIVKSSSSFPDVMPQIWSYCREVIFVCEGESGVSDQLRRALCGSASTPVASLARPMSFFESLEEAFGHAEGVCPFDILELRRARLLRGCAAHRLAEYE